jgi:methylenetetrahydrofolate dehydrogenase (NADP+)/methenyltetrahydrofolate cyclohydrolase
MIVDGRAISLRVLAEAKEEVKRLGREPVVRAVVAAPSPATESYLSIKQSRAEDAGMRLEVVRADAGADEAELMRLVEAPGADAVIVQLPLPAGLDTERVLNAIPLSKDADVLSCTAYAPFEKGEPGALVPPVAAAVERILAEAGTNIAGKNAVVVGDGFLVGKPVAVLLRRLGAEVSVVTRDTAGKEDMYREADIIVSGAGSAHIIRPDMVKEGVVLIDAGTSESNGAIAGDIDPTCAEKASLYTPVPGGVGPVAVAMLFKNAARLLP